MWLKIIVLYLALKPCNQYNLKKSTTMGVFSRWQWPPVKMGRWHFWVEQLTTRHLNNMTAELARDVEVKYRMVKSVTDGSKKDGAQFSVGQIAAEMKARFKHMVQIYVTYARYNDMAINNEYTDTNYWVERSNRDVKNYIYAYMFIESDYNEIMMFNDMFFEYMTLKKKQSQIKLQEELLELNKTLQLSKISHENTSVATQNWPPTTQSTTMPTSETKAMLRKRKMKGGRHRHRNDRKKHPEQRQQRRPRPNKNSDLEKFAD